LIEAYRHAGRDPPHFCVDILGPRSAAQNIETLDTRRRSHMTEMTWTTMRIGGQLPIDKIEELREIVTRRIQRCAIR
jgi:hypothetical protein